MDSLTIFDTLRKNFDLSNKLLVVLGPSLSSKTSLGLILARYLKTSIISTDSRQVYKHLDYSTGKLKFGDSFNFKKGLGFWLIDDIYYWGYDIMEANYTFSAADFVNFVNNEVISNITSVPIIVGGTGLYINALLGNLNLGYPKPNFKLRKKLEKKSILELHQILKKLDFDLNILNNSDLHNKRRLIRKIEILSHRPKGFIGPTVADKFSLLNYYKINPLYIRLERKSYKSFVQSWLDKNFENIKKEVDWLLSNYPKSPLFEGFIFKEFKKHLTRNLPKIEVKNQITTSYLRYIKRQKTYFNKYFPQSNLFIVD